jgi:hypothetical protein
MTETTKTLIAARKILAENGWAQKAFAKDANGVGVLPEATTAVAFCALGALDRACHEESFPYIAPRHVLNRATHAITGDGHWSNISYYNDEKERTKEDVLALYDNAIELSKGEENVEPE